MATAKKKAAKKPERTFDARPDTLDFRDRMFEPTLVEVPSRIDLAAYKELKVPILDQGNEGACTGFGLATVVHYLLRRRRVIPDKDEVSPRMLYEMAKRYDEWPGEDYSGSSARGAMKGWHKHGVCSSKLWPYDPKKADCTLSNERIQDAVRRPLGSYLRVNHKDLVAMHVALAEVGILYATSGVHAGWETVGEDGIIPTSDELRGGHAFAIVAYDERGFWIQNSWGKTWGAGGYALVSYDDWLRDAQDVWVARLGVPVVLRTRQASATSLSDSAGDSRAYAFQDVKPHTVSIGNNGRLRTHGEYGTSADEVEALFKKTIPGVTAKWKGPKRILLYAHGGLVSESSAVQRTADYRSALLDSEVYPISFIWKTDYWSTLTNILQDAVRSRRPEGALDSAKDFMLDRLDDMLEPVARLATGKSQWDEMKENALLATRSKEGGARLALAHLAKLVQGGGYEVHVAGHSAGSIFHAPLVQLLATQGKITDGPLKGETGLGIPIRTCTLWAPACTIDLFNATYRPLIEARRIEHFCLFTLTDEAEQDDHCANIYHKSLLYLVSHAFEKRFYIPGVPQHRGEPLLGMEAWVKAGGLEKLFDGNRVDWVRAPNLQPEGSPDASTARAHGGFDDDRATVKATLARILGKQKAKTEMLPFHRSGSALRDRRRRVEQAVPMRPAI